MDKVEKGRDYMWKIKIVGGEGGERGGIGREVKAINLLSSYILIC